MIDYKYADLYYEDSTDKQLNIETEDGSVITNEDIYAEEMDLDESLCSETSLKFGCCEASTLKLKIANRFSPLYNQWLTVRETIGGNDDEPFLFGKYKVQSDRPTADRSYRDITAYDAMYDIINADGTEVADWYNTILPEDDSTVTLKEFRESFLAFLGIEEVSSSLVNDDMIVEKTISTSSLSGRRVITCICEINGVFGHITREGKFEYIQLEPIDESKAFDIPINKYSDYEDFDTGVINCLQIREDDTDPGVVYGSGANRYIIEGNFLLYGKTTEDLITVTANLYPVINRITYRPANIMSPGNPCIEVGDILHLSTKYQEIYTYALRRSYIGIQAVTDSYMSYGTETYIDDGGSLQEKIEQVKSRTAELADEVKEATETVNIVVEQVAADYASILVLESEVANIQTLFAEYATIEDLQAALATIGELYVTYEEVDFLLSGYASITDLDAVTANITNINADVANIKNVLLGNAGVGDLQSIVLTTDNAYIEDAVILNALVGTVLADIIDSNIIYTDNITIMSENGGIVLAGTTMQFSDETGNVRLQLGQDADGNFTFILYDETGTGILIDSEGIHASAVPDGLIVDQMVAEDANISASKINMADVTDYLNEAGELILNAYQVTIDGETLDYKLSQITQSIEDLEMEGVVSIENWYALGTKDNPPCDPDEEINDCVLGVMILGEAKLGFTNWTTEQPDYLDDEYTWFAQKVTYVGGQVVWTTPTLLTDYYVRNKISVQETELEVVQGQIQARVWLSDIESVSDFLQNEITTISDQYGILTVTIDTIDERVGTLTTTVDTYYSELSSQVTAITLDLEGITAEVRDVSEKTANAIIDGIPYYAISDDPNWYPPQDPSEEETSVLGTMVLGKAILGIRGDDWTTEQPEFAEGEYIWLSYYRTRVDGSTYWTEPTLLTDEWARLAEAEMSEKYAELVLTVDSALLQVANIQTDIKENYSTTTEVLACISESVTDEYATIMQQVSYNYATKDEVTTITATIEQYVDASMASITISVSGGTPQIDYANCQNFSEGKCPDGWFEDEGEDVGIYEYITDDTKFGSYAKITNVSSSSNTYPCLVFNAGHNLPSGDYLIRFKARTLEGQEDSAQMRIRYVYYDDDESEEQGSSVGSGNINVTNSDKWETYEYVLSPKASEYNTCFFVGAYTKGTSICFTDFQVLYPAETGTSERPLGNTASIVLSTNGRTQIAELDLTEVREAFADDESAITIAAGAIAFISNTFICESDYFKVSAEGNIIATSGTIGGWIINDDTIKTSTDFKYPGYYDEIEGLLLGNSSGLPLLYVYGDIGETFEITRKGEAYGYFSYLESEDGIINASGVTGDEIGNGFIGFAGYDNVFANSNGLRVCGKNTLEFWYTYSSVSTISISSSYISATGTVRIANLTVTGTKSRLIETKDFGERLTQAYETAGSYFGDLGSGITGEDGLCYISIDDIFGETIDTSIEYHVFLQKEGKGDLWISEKHGTYFIVEGDPNLSFSWELKATQRDYSTTYMDEDSLLPLLEDEIDNDLQDSLDRELKNYDREMEDDLNEDYKSISNY